MPRRADPETIQDHRQPSAAFAWIKVRVGLLNDPAVMRLSDRAFRRYLELNLLASDLDPRDGRLPAASDIAWRLRVTPKALQLDLTTLERSGLLTRDGDELGLPRFASEQARMTDAERQRAHREREARNADGHEPVTGRDGERNKAVTARPRADESREDKSRPDNSRADHGAVAPADDVDPVAIADLSAFNIPEQTAIRLLKDHGRERVNAACLQVSDAVATGKARNPGGLLRSLLEPGRAPAHDVGRPR